MKKNLLLLSILTLLFVGACPAPTRLVRLTIISKSDVKVAVQLTGVDDTTKFYYFLLPKASRELPVELTFTIIPQRYDAKVWYLYIYDPVYGLKCNDNPGSKADLTRNIRLTILQCGSSVRHNNPEPGFYIY